MIKPSNSNILFTMENLRPAVLFLFLILVIFPAATENYIDENFSAYGIQSIGIYTESYADARSDDFVFEVAAIRANGILMDADFFRYRYSNYDLITPPLTTPEYPLEKGAETATDKLLRAGITEYLDEQGWPNGYIEDFQTGTLADLLAAAQQEGFDAALVVRYTPILYLVPVENYKPSSAGSKATADIGKIKKGMGLYPAIELYDTQSGSRLWYSAYHAGQQVLPKKKSYTENTETAEEFFAHTDKGAAEAAVDKMTALTFSSENTPFPAASVSGSGNAELTGNPAIMHMFWTDFPAYARYGNSWGIGYSLDYVGNYPIRYKDNISEDSPVEQAGTLANLIMHNIYMPFFSVAYRNIMLDPSLHLGFTLPTYANIEYDDIKKYGSIEHTLDAAAASFTSLGLDLSLKYSLRFTDQLSAYIGGSAEAAFWWQQIQGYETTADNFTDSFSALYTNYDINLLLNASVLAGVRWDIKTPVELYTEFTPVGPGGGLMVSAGVRFIPFTYGFIDPHARNIAGNTRGY